MEFWKRIGCLFWIVILGGNLICHFILGLETPVYVTHYGEKYHTRHCGYLNAYPIRYDSAEDAKDAGYTPCSVCH